MSNATDDSATAPGAGEILSDVRLTGRVKWFNNRAGFGFITVLTEGDKKDEDVFVHHSGIVVESEQYKYLVQGEYVSFNLRSSDNSEHPYQAGDVRGVMSGWLMCETRNSLRTTRSEDGDSDGAPRKATYRPRRRVRPNGGGPREGGNDQWVLNRQGDRRSGRQQSTTTTTTDSA